MESRTQTVLNALTRNPLPQMNSLPQERFPRTYQVIQHGISHQLHRGMQVFISRDFEPVADFAVGENVSEVPLTPDFLLPWLSAGKPLTAAAILQRVQHGQLKLESPVCDVIPEFAAAGKEAITLENLLTHTAGLKPIATGWPKRTWGEIVDKICQTGTRRDRGDGLECGYDPARSWFILGEMLQRVDAQQRTVDQIIRQDVLEPLGMFNSWMAIPTDRLDEFRPRLGTTYSSQNDVLTPTPGNTDEYCLTPSPGGSMRGPIRELARFYEMLLRQGTTADGTSLLDPEIVRLMLQRRRQGEFDATFQHVVDFGLGIIINSNRYGAETVPYGFGRHASENSFGHGGAQSSIGFADPKYKLVVTAVANGLPGEQVHNHRFKELNSAIYEDLDLD
ncbi:serine hydrolase domain-containing protein [Planctomicrobium sp. SH661]|uniref:serine hydrolase domain-containing protein n=1 Tax=Planctomicrobium sp. SH661 TaxID=3448124 RepID=UPI003F5C1286